MYPPYCQPRRTVTCFIVSILLIVLNVSYIVITTSHMYRYEQMLDDIHDISIKTRLTGPSSITTHIPLRASDENDSNSRTLYHDTLPRTTGDPDTTSSKSILSSPIVRDLPTDPTCTSYRVQQQHSDFHKCDTLRVTIEARDSLKRLKLTGGDYFWAWLHNTEYNATAAADEIIDHGNGTYTAVLTLFWLGDAHVNVRLVHTSETVATLKRIRDNNTVPRNAYEATFIKDHKTKKGKRTYTKTPCHISTDMYVPWPASITPRPSYQFCNYTDPKLGIPWFCLKPRDLPCDAYWKHYKKLDNYKTATDTFSLLLNPDELRLLKKTYNIGIERDPSSFGSVYVKPYYGSKSYFQPTCQSTSPPECTMGLNPSPHYVNGYYYQDKWASRVCRTRQFNRTATSIRKCLKTKHVQFYSDSTGRQWFEYLINTIGDARGGISSGIDPTIDGAVMAVNVTNKKNGPITAFAKDDNISLSFMFHGLPFTCNRMYRDEIDYIANRMDRFDKGGPGSIIVISVWAHFWISDLQFYRDRLKSIKDAILRLHKRAPGTRIFFKSPNTMNGAKSITFGNTNWGMAELHRVLQEEMTDFVDVTVIDVWDMTIGHWSGLNIHPIPIIIEQEVDILLSYICPQQ